MNNLGQRVKDIRLALNKTQEEFGAQIGIKKNSLVYPKRDTLCSELSWRW